MLWLARWKISVLHQEKKSDLKPPSVYSGSDRDWHNWNTELQYYLGVLTNADGDPLACVISDETRRMKMINLGGIFALTFEVPIEGKTFDRDNHAVHLIMKRHTVGGTAETYVTQFEGNGRDAYLALATARDGANSQHTVICECQEWLNQAHFECDTVSFTFTSYCDTFMQCYNELEQRNVFTNEYLKVEKFLSGTTNSSFHSIKTTIIANNAADDKMNDLQLAIAYAKTATVALVFISSTSHMSPRRRIGMHYSEESNHAFGSNSDSPIRGRGRGRGRRRPQHGFEQGHGGPMIQRGGSPYHSPRGGRGPQRFGQNISHRGGSGNFNDESFIPRELFQQLSPTQRLIFLRGRDVYNSRGEMRSKFSCQTITQLGALIRSFLRHHLGHHQADLTQEAHLPYRLALNLDAVFA
jgi:hypothetical protein